MSDERWRKEKRDRLRRLRDLGVPTEIPADIEDCGFLIRQEGSYSENCAFDLSCGGTGFIIGLCITMNRPRLAIDYFSLEVSWQDTSFYWLTEPVETVALKGVYQFPGRGPEFPRDVVINHFANFNRQWSRGQSMRGLLLGVGSETIPTDYRHGDLIPALITVMDQYEVPSLRSIRLWVDRSAKLSKPSTKKPRRKLIEHPDVEVYDSLETELKSERAQ